jgi:hypothetical protein
MSYTGLVFLLDFANFSLHDLELGVAYIPFAGLAIIGPDLKFALWLQNNPSYRSWGKSALRQSQPEIFDVALRNQVDRPSHVRASGGNIPRSRRPLRLPLVASASIGQ